MARDTLLSILITVGNQRDIVEPTLAAILDAESIPLEVIIIDDGSTDGSSDAIQSLLDYYEHEAAYYFEHQQPAGRSQSLNEALLQATGKVVWTPNSIGQLDQSLLMELAKKLSSSDSYFSVHSPEYPTDASSPLEWINYIQKDQWIENGLFLWNRENIPVTDFYFNPSISSFQNVELATRLSSHNTPVREESFYTPSEFEENRFLTNSHRLQLCFTLLRDFRWSSKERESVIQLINNVSKDLQPPSKDNRYKKLFAEAQKMKVNGRFTAALELIENILENDPEHPKAKQLKIEILEKKRRFVEASELKHEMYGEKETAGSTDDIVTSIVIPTAVYGKPALEQCLVSIANHSDPAVTELIIIDNASLDDTHDYLAELKEKNFFNCSVITNKENKGFAASVNQGLDAAHGDYACVMHNDVQLKDNAIKQLQDHMELYPNYAILGLMTNKTLNPDQSTRNQKEHTSDIVRAEYLDSFCMMIRMDTDLRMDDSYQLCFFDDIDLCFQARKKGHRVGIATDVVVDHHYGTTTFALNLDTESEQYWKNVSYFNDKWSIEVYSEEELKSKSTFDQLLAIDQMVNPLYPEKPLKEHFNRLFTDELKTELLRSEHEDETLCQLVHLMMVMDEREVMRRLEDRLDRVDLPAPLIYQLVRFYFNRNIYSRCTHYLGKLKAEQQSLKSELYKLEIMVNEKVLEYAIPKLKELLDQAPSNPRLYKLAGDIYQFEGVEDEAESFYEIAQQINPFMFTDSDAEMKETLL